MKTVILFFLCALFSSHNSEARHSQTPTGFVLFFQKLSELSSEDSLEYIFNLREQLKNSKELELEKMLYSTKESQHCQKLKKPSCRQALYGKDLCIPPKKVASDYCEKISKPLKQNVLEDPLFDRMPWNRWALSVNQLCIQKLTLACKKLSKLHDKFEVKHRKYQDELKKSLTQ